jgi:putative transcriptional regulator
MRSLTGHLLVASRHLRDPNFRQSVVLMLEHAEQGALGVVLNRPSERTIREVWDAVKADPVDNDEVIYVGGPVPGPLIALHDSEALGEKLVLPGVYMSMQRTTLDQLVREPDQLVRVFNGNSGWASGQLEGELKAGGWLRIEATADDVFADPQSLWKDTTQRIGLSIMLPGTSPDQLPGDPTSN